MRMDGEFEVLLVLPPRLSGLRTLESRIHGSISICGTFDDGSAVSDSLLMNRL